MATGISTIFISGLEGKTYSLYFPMETLNETTISELKRAVQDITRVDPDTQRLLYGTKLLEPIQDGRKRTFGIII